MPPPNYTKKQLSDWLYKNGYLEYYQKWKNSNFQKKYKPSIDRIDDLKPYTFANIRLCTWQDNFEHFINDIKSGIGTGGKRVKKILQFKDGKHIATYTSYSEATRCVGYKFDNIINKNKTDKWNYQWVYQEYIDKVQTIDVKAF